MVRQKETVVDGGREELALPGKRQKLSKKENQEELELPRKPKKKASQQQNGTEPKPKVPAKKWKQEATVETNENEKKNEQEEFPTKPKKKAKQQQNSTDESTKSKKRKLNGKQDNQNKSDHAELPGKTAKKMKKTKAEQNGTNDENVKPEKHEDNDKKLDSSSISKPIFGIFNKLQDKTQSKNTQKCINEMIQLLTDESNEDKRIATCAYALKRLVRCTGADDKAAVALNASYINGILCQVPDLDPIDLLNILKRELHVSTQQKGKEESLAAVGKLITSFAILQSQHFDKPSAALIAAIYPILIVHLKGREYLVTMCADIMADSFKQVSAKSFETHIWPLLQPELNKPLAERKLHGCDLLLAVHLNYPKLVTLKQLKSSLWHKEPQYEQLFELYLNSAIIQSDGVYARLGKFLATATKGDELLKIWQMHVVKQLPLKHSAAKSYVILTLSYVLMHYDDSHVTAEEEHSPLAQLFSLEPLVSMVLQELEAAKHLTEKAKPKAKPVKFQLRHVCRKFETVLLLSFQHQLKQESSKLAILRQLLQLQPQLDNVAQTPRLTQLLIAQLGEQGLQDILKFYSEQFTSNAEELTKTHREQCLKQMQQLLLNPLLIKRNAHLDFLLQASIFHLDDEQKPCLADKAAAFSCQAASRCEEILFSCLTNKIGSSTEQLAKFNKQLRHILKPLAKLLAEPEIDSKMRSKLTELHQVWETQLQQVVIATNKENETLLVVFDALILFLGLSIYAPSCNVSVELLNDIIICKQNALKPKLGKGKGKAKAEPETELCWQDVLTDVLLQLLLQTGNFWRAFVNAIGGALVPHLSRDNLEQMLVVLDMHKNPLGAKESDEDSEDEEVEEEEVDEQTSDEEETEDEEDDEENVEDGEGDGDEATNLEQIRENVRLALLNDDNNDNDASSVDWNDVDEEQGERLNLALERAFHAFKPKGKSNKSQSEQQTKSERISSTALLHFRIRVLDLVELFITAQPQLEVLLDALNSTYYVYKFSSNDTKLQPLAEASKKLLRKLLAQKINYKSAQQNKEPIIDSIRLFMEPEQQQPNAAKNLKQKPQPSIKVKGDLAEWRNKCVAYLVSQFNEPDVTTSAVWPLLQSYLQDWATHRNSQHTLSSFDALFNNQWSGIAQLAASFGTLLLTDNLRQFRRMQIITFLVKHLRHIRNALANNTQAAKDLTASLAKYQPSKPDDRNLHTKLLAQLQQPTAKASV